MENLTSLPVEPIYWQDQASSPIQIGELEISIPQKDEKTAIRLQASARLCFAPYPSVELNASLCPENEWLLKTLLGPVPDALRVRFTDFNTEADVFVSWNGNDLILHPKMIPLQPCSNCETIQSATFHLFNWPKIHGSQDVGVSNRGWHLIGRAILFANTWKVTINSMFGTSEAVNSLKKTGGYRITHVGRIERENGEKFSTDELNDLLIKLRYFFLFTLGYDSGPNLTVGYDENRRTVYQQVGVSCVDGTVTDLPSDSTWFDCFIANDLTLIFPGFIKLSQSDVWGKVIRDVIYWHSRANQGRRQLGVDSGIMFSQSALELLAWNYCVLDRKMVSREAFKPGKLLASDKLRMLMTSLGIPTDIPRGLLSLQKQGKEGWDDSMHAIVDVRNSLVHPDSNKTYSPDQYYEVWKLSMWYLDLVILRLCGYSGTYSSRVSAAGESRLIVVPWASDAT